MKALKATLRWLGALLTSPQVLVSAAVLHVFWTTVFREDYVVMALLQGSWMVLASIAFSLIKIADSPTVHYSAHFHGEERPR